MQVKTSVLQTAFLDENSRAQTQPPKKQPLSSWGQPYQREERSLQNEVQSIHPKILNLSSYQTSQREINILKKGMKFCPTPEHNDHIREKCDITEFCRKLKMKEFFYDTELTDISLVHPPSIWEPDAGRNCTLDSAVNFVKSLSTSKNVTKNVSNISKIESQSIIKLKKTIIILW